MSVLVPRAVVAEAKEKYLLDPLFHARAKLGEQIVETALADKWRGLNDAERDLVSLAVSVGILMAQVHPEGIGS